MMNATEKTTAQAALLRAHYTKKLDREAQRAREKTYEIRESTMTGAVLATVTAEGIEAAAAKGARTRAVVEKFGGRFGVNRETGSPGKSGCFSLRQQGNNKGQIHVSEQ